MKRRDNACVRITVWNRFRQLMIHETAQMIEDISGGTGALYGRSAKDKLWSNDRTKCTLNNHE
jgi:hypothetical protein